MSASLARTQYNLELPLILQREISAPVDLVWQAYTNPAHLGQWWGPAGCVTQVIHMDLRPGGTFIYSMTSSDAVTLWAKWTFLEVHAPTRLVFLLAFCNQTGKTIRYSEEPTWPLEMHAILTLAAKGGHTLLQQQLSPWNASEQEHMTFALGKESMKTGFNATWDQLAKHL